MQSRRSRVRRFVLLAATFAIVNGGRLTPSIKGAVAASVHSEKPVTRVIRGFRRPILEGLADPLAGLYRSIENTASAERLIGAQRLPPQ